MANFSIALCILLVACGAQGATVRVEISEMLQDLQNQIQSQIKNLVEAFESAVAKVTDFNEKLTSAMESQIEDLKANLGELSANVQGVNSCISENVDPKGLINEVASTTISCALGVIRSLRDEYDELKTAFEALANKLKDVRAEIEECSAGNNPWESVTCTASVWRSEIKEISSSFIDLIKRAGSLVVRISQIESELSACGSRSAIETFESRLSTAIPEIKECIRNLKDETTAA